MSRYSRVAILLHWLMALLIIFTFAAGVWMHEAIDVPETRARAFEVYQLHKSLGLTILLLTALRLLWRLTHQPPPLPAAMKKWERTLAQLTHWLFYALMIAIPLSGWAMVSASPLGLPTLWFGLFEWPHLPAFAAVADRKAATDALAEVHELFAMGGLALLGLHVAAALKHHFIDRDDVLVRMLPGHRRG